MEYQDLFYTLRATLHPIIDPDPTFWTRSNDATHAVLKALSRAGYVISGPIFQQQ